MTASGYSPPMATARAQSPIPKDIYDSLEQLIFGAIGLTSFALSQSSATDLTLPQWRALVVIGRSESIRVGEIAARIGMSLPSTSRLIGRLERRGYVSTERDETDRRATLVRMTATGHRVRDTVIARRRQLIDAALVAYADRLPKDLSRGLATLAKAFDRYE